MNDALLGKVVVSLHDLLHITTGLVLRESLLDHFAEIGVAKFSDDVGIVLGGEDIMEGEYVREVFKFFQDLNFAIQKYPVDLVLEHLEVDDLDRHVLICVPHPLPVSSCRPR